MKETLTGQQWPISLKTEMMMMISQALGEYEEDSLLPNVRG
jgi:hypothetical protein